MKNILENLIQTIERNAIDNKATIHNVQLWAASWRAEMQTEQKLNIDGVVQAEGSEKAKQKQILIDLMKEDEKNGMYDVSAVGAAVGNGAAGQSGSGGCRHRWWELASGKVLCDKCGVVKD